MELTSAPRVAFLTQDAEPASEHWLERLTAPYAALTFGPYLARPGAPAPLRREYAELFASEPETFVSSANLSLSRAAWSGVPFRDVPYAEDQQLALDLAAAGEARAYVPDAAVLHSHEYGAVERVRRYFDEFRALHELYGWRAPASPRIMAGTVRAEVRKDRAYEPGAPLGPSVAFHTARVVGAALGTRADRLPAALRRRLSLEGRA
jgi:rhamnosyltransferase